MSQTHKLCSSLELKNPLSVAFCLRQCTVFGTRGRSHQMKTHTHMLPFFGSLVAQLCRLCETKTLQMGVELTFTSLLGNVHLLHQRRNNYMPASWRWLGSVSKPFLVILAIFSYFAYFFYYYLYWTGTHVAKTRRIKAFVGKVHARTCHVPMCICLFDVPPLPPPHTRQTRMKYIIWNSQLGLCPLCYALILCHLPYYVLKFLPIMLFENIKNVKGLLQSSRLLFKLIVKKREYSLWGRRMAALVICCRPMYFISLKCQSLS